MSVVMSGRCDKADASADTDGASTAAPSLQEWYYQHELTVQAFCTGTRLGHGCSCKCIRKVLVIHVNPVLLTIRALQKYMHEFHADRDNAKCNVQNHTLPVQLTQLQTLSTKYFEGHWCSQKLTVMPSASVQSGSTGD
jgi:hypothetical protein